MWFVCTDVCGCILNDVEIKVSEAVILFLLEFWKYFGRIALCSVPCKDDYCIKLFEMVTFCSPFMWYREQLRPWFYTIQMMLLFKSQCQKFIDWCCWSPLFFADKISLHNWVFPNFKGGKAWETFRHLCWIWSVSLWKQFRLRAFHKWHTSKKIKTENTLHNNYKVFAHLLD